MRLACRRLRSERRGPWYVDASAYADSPVSDCSHNPLHVLTGSRPFLGHRDAEFGDLCQVLKAA